jgi:hypothetical protein
MPNTQSQQLKLSNRMLSHFNLLPLRPKKKPNVLSKRSKASKLSKLSERPDFVFEPCLKLEPSEILPVGQPCPPIVSVPLEQPVKSHSPSKETDMSREDSGFCSLSSHSCAPSLQGHFELPAESPAELPVDEKFVELKKARSGEQNVNLCNIRNERQTTNGRPVPQQVNLETSCYQDEGALGDRQSECRSLGESPFLASRHSYAYHLSLNSGLHVAP